MVPKIAPWRPMPWPADSTVAGPPTLIGEVGLSTRSMLVKRAGRPRSWTSAASPSPIAPAAPSLAPRARSGRPVACAPAPSSDEAPAGPPRNRYRERRRLAASPHRVRRSRRPADPERWSTREYACHVRDLLVLCDKRLNLMLTRDDPTFANWDPDEAAATGRYRELVPAEVATEITDAAGVAAGVQHSR